MGMKSAVAEINRQHIAEAKASLENENLLPEVRAVVERNLAKMEAYQKFLESDECQDW